MRPPNVIFLIIDSLRADRTGLGGHRPSPSPVLDGWLGEGLVLRRNFATGCPTEFAYPGLMTSTLPLDHGGYTNGITSRPQTLAESFQAAGYRTMRIVHDSFEANSGYGRGFAESIYRFDLRRLRERAMIEIGQFRRFYRADPGALPQLAAELAARLRHKFAEYDQYAAELAAADQRGDLQDTLLLQGIDYARLRELVLREQSVFVADPRAYAEPMITEQGPEALGFLQKFAQGQQPKLRSLDRPGRWLILLSFLALVRHAAAGWPNRQALRHHSHYFGRPLASRVKYPSGAYYIEQLGRWIADQKGAQPFFAWLHLVDIHDQNFWSFDLPGDGQRQRAEYRAHREFLARIADRGSAYPGSPVYDLSVRYTDLQLGRLREILRQTGRARDTLVVITGDHGHNFPFWPRRAPFHQAEAFFDDLYHVPAGVVGPGVPARVHGGLSSSMDLGPTVLGLAGLPIPTAFRGRDLSQADAPEVAQVFSEHMGPGLCDFARKSMRIAVRSASGKLIYEVAPAAAADGGVVRAYYDLAADPHELCNLAAEPAGPERQRLEALVQARVQEIRKSAAPH
jgi:arylsulfatase A-like enzyme